MDTSIFGGNAGITGGSIGNGDNYAHGDFRMPFAFGAVNSRRVFGGGSAKTQKVKPANIKKLA